MKRRRRAASVSGAPNRQIRHRPISNRRFSHVHRDLHSAAPSFFLSLPPVCLIAGVTPGCDYYAMGIRRRASERHVTPLTVMFELRGLLFFECVPCAATEQQREKPSRFPFPPSPPLGACDIRFAPFRDRCCTAQRISNGMKVSRQHSQLP